MGFFTFLRSGTCASHTGVAQANFKCKARWASQLLSYARDRRTPGLLLPIVLFCSCIHQGLSLDSRAGQVQDLVERSELQSLLRDIPRTSQHFRIFDHGFDLERVWVYASISFNDVQSVGMKRHAPFRGYPVCVGEVRLVDDERITVPVAHRISTI